MEPISAVTSRISPQQRALAKQVRHHRVDNPFFASAKALVESNPDFAEQAARMVSDMVQKGGPGALKFVSSIGKQMGIPPEQMKQALSSFHRDQMTELAKPVRTPKAAVLTA